MIHAYNEVYLDDACNLLGSYFDVAVNEYGHTLKDAWKRFLFSNIANEFERGSPFVISGLSGPELFNRVYDSNRKSMRPFINKTIEYWFGYYLAYYQWCTSVRFGMVDYYIDSDEILNMYRVYHEMDIMHFIEQINRLINQRKNKTNLELHRLLMKLTRSELSRISGVPTRTIEQYEQGLKDINKAKVVTLMALSRALLVEIEDLLELTRA